MTRRVSILGRFGPASQCFADGRRRRVAGRSLTLDAIETGVLPAFAEPRLFLTGC